MGVEILRIHGLSRGECIAREDPRRLFNSGEHQKPQRQAEGKGHWRKTEVTGAQGDPGEQIIKPGH